MKYLGVKDILKIHKEIEKIFKVDSLILFPNNLELAVEIPKIKVFGIEKYSTVAEKAAALMYNLIKLHPFLDGNKRTALLAALIFLELNNRTFKRNKSEEMFQITLGTAKCNTNIEQLIVWINKNSRKKAL